MSKEIIKQEIEQLCSHKEDAYNKKDWKSVDDIRDKIYRKIEELLTLQFQEDFADKGIEDAHEIVRSLLGEELEEGYDAIKSVIDEEGEFEANGFKFEWVDQYGGEGQGDEYWVIFSVTKNGVTKNFKVDGWYASYHGSELEYDGFYEVEKAEKTVEYWKNV